jgi:hypothetical protein
MSGREEVAGERGDTGEVLCGGNLSTKSDVAVEFTLRVKGFGFGLGGSVLLNEFLNDMDCDFGHEILLISNRKDILLQT